ncbi:hypothetical protein D1872_318650 [compost metagenome]
MCLKQQRDHSRVPIVRMQNVWLEINFRKHFEHRPIEKGKPFSVIHVTVHAIPRKIVLIIDKVNGNAFMD